MTREPVLHIVDREGAISDVKRLAEILWDVHEKGAASKEDTRDVCAILFRWHPMALHHSSPREMIDAVYGVTSDLEFSLKTVLTLFPKAVIETCEVVLPLSSPRRLS